jgi:hypothetical protein
LRLKLDLDEVVTARLVEQAAAEKRPIPWQAEVVLRRGLELPFPEPVDTEEANKKPVLEGIQ